MGRPRVIATPKDFEARVDAYVDACRENGEPVLLTGLILALGLCSKSAFYAYEERKGFRDAVRRARLLVEHAYEAALHKGNVSGPIFALKNFGWSDKAEMRIESDARVEHSVSPAVEAALLRLRGEPDEAEKAGGGAARPPAPPSAGHDALHPTGRIDCGKAETNPTNAGVRGNAVPPAESGTASRRGMGWRPMPQSENDGRNQP